MPRRKPPVIAAALLDQLLDGADARTAVDADGLLGQLKKALAEGAPHAEMDHRLADGEPGDRRNGCGRKAVTTGTGRMGWRSPAAAPAASTRRRSRSAGSASRASTGRSSRCTPAA